MQWILQFLCFISTAGTFDSVPVTQLLLPPSILKSSSRNPLRDEPNLSLSLPLKKLSIIKGSRQAKLITKRNYLKKGWCKSQPMRQIIRERGCLRYVMVNRFCYGQCNSFFIPKKNRKDDSDSAFQSCSFCKPWRFTMHTIRLRCPGQRQRFKKKRVRKIKSCKCMALDLS